MSHGDNIGTHTGTCGVCGRTSVALKEARHQPGKFVCVDQFACFDQWQLNRGHRYLKRLQPRGPRP